MHTHDNFAGASWARKKPEHVASHCRATKHKTHQHKNAAGAAALQRPPLPPPQQQQVQQAAALTPHPT
jgi:formate-dependent nitrite reductase cytochrome c552 subunit